VSFLSLLNEHRNPIQNELSEAIAEERIGTDCFFQNRAYILWNLRPVEHPKMADQTPANLSQILGSTQLSSASPINSNT
jgi:hypothetical protein